MLDEHLSHINELIEHNKNNAKDLKSVKIRYHKISTARHVTRKVSPYAIKGNVLVAFDHKRKAVRTFRTDRIKTMEKIAFWNGFEKRASAVAEAIGLTGLMAPSALSLGGKPMKEKHKDLAEIGGLSVLLAPYLKPAYQETRKGFSTLAKLKPHIGRLLRRV